MVLPLVLSRLEPGPLCLLVVVAGLAGACQSDGGDPTLDDWPPTGTAAGDSGNFAGASADGGTSLFDATTFPNGTGGYDGSLIAPFDGALDADAHTADAQLSGSGEAGLSSDSGDGFDASSAVDAATPVDASGVDASALDASVPDAGMPDAGVPDAGIKDAGVPDAGIKDASVPDAGIKDAGAPSITSCTVTATTVAPTAGSYAPAYGSALWINNASGKLVKKFAVYGNGSHTSLPQYNTAASGVAGVDTVTSATLRSTKSYSFTWDLKSPSGSLVADGNYTFQIETRAGVGDRLAKVAFAKSAAPVNASVADGNGVTGAKVTCQ